MFATSDFVPGERDSKSNPKESLEEEEEEEEVDAVAVAVDVVADGDEGVEEK